MPAFLLKKQNLCQNLRDELLYFLLPQGAGWVLNFLGRLRQFLQTGEELIHHYFRQKYKAFMVLAY